MTERLPKFLMGALKPGGSMIGPPCYPESILCELHFNAEGRREVGQESNRPIRWGRVSDQDARDHYSCQICGWYPPPAQLPAPVATGRSVIDWATKEKDGMAVFQSKYVRLTDPPSFEESTSGFISADDLNKMYDRLKREYLTLYPMVEKAIKSSFAPVSMGCRVETTECPICGMLSLSTGRQEAVSLPAPPKGTKIEVKAPASLSGRFDYLFGKPEFIGQWKPSDPFRYKVNYEPNPCGEVPLPGLRLGGHPPLKISDDFLVKVVDISSQSREMAVTWFGDKWPVQPILVPTGNIALAPRPKKRSSERISLKHVPAGSNCDIFLGIGAGGQEEWETYLVVSHNKGLEDKTWKQVVKTGRTILSDGVEASEWDSNHQVAPPTRK